VSDLRSAILQILESERAYPPLSVESLCRIFRATGYAGGPVEPGAVAAALGELLAAGQVERVHSLKMGPRYRAMVAARPIAAGETIRT